MENLPYQVFNSAGQMVMHAPEICRYSRRVEKSLLEAGYTIRLHGKRITRTDLRKEETKP